MNASAEKIGEQVRGNFVAVTTDEPQINNWHTAIYEDDYKGLLIALCNQNGRYPWQVRAILAGLNAKREAADALSKAREPSSAEAARIAKAWDTRSRQHLPSISAADIFRDGWMACKADLSTTATANPRLHVKPLEWDDFHAKSPVGPYSIVRHHSHFALVGPEDSFDGFGYPFEGPLEKCREAAQADFEQRVLACLVSP